MGKKNKHSQDKLHKTVSELTSHHLGSNRELELSAIHRRLKYDTCCLTLDAVSKKPMGLCDDDNFCYVFECEPILEFLEKYQVHPITGKKVNIHDLFEIKFHRNEDNEYHCPIIYKIFNHNSKIVANKKSGHVYSYEAYNQLNLKPSFFRDLLTDKPFEKKDIVFIQDPMRVEEKWSVSSFYYVKEKLKLKNDADCSNKIRNVEESSILKSSLDEYKKNADKIASDFNKLVGQDGPAEALGSKLDSINRAVHSDGSLSRSVTSTVMPITSAQTHAELGEEEILYSRVKKKGYVQLMTSLGPLNLELFCDRTPKTCHNFLLLAARKYYDNTCFHRLIKNFIIQGGDPTGTGKGGQSAWGAPFRDECHGDLKHTGRGVLAMANSGPGTNKSQFYITLKGVWDHLDGKHTIFGRVVGGESTLDRFELVEVDKKERPKEEIKILHITKYVDPFEEAQTAIEEERNKEAQASSARKGNTLKRGTADKPMVKKFRSGVGVYVDLDRLHKSMSVISAEKVPHPTVDDDDNDNESNKISLSAKLAAVSASNRLDSAQTRKNESRGFGDFSNW